jgi:protocadherin-16/23
VNIDIEDINDSVPSFESTTVRISVPENFELGFPLYVVSASDRDSGKSGTVTYRLSSNGAGSMISTSSSNIATSNPISMLSSSNLFNIDARTGHLTLSQHLDFETSQRHTLVVTATDLGEPPLSSNLTIFVEVQDVNDNRYEK